MLGAVLGLLYVYAFPTQRFEILALTSPRVNEPTVRPRQSRYRPTRQGKTKNRSHSLSSSPSSSRRISTSASKNPDLIGGRGGKRKKPLDDQGKNREANACQHTPEKNPPEPSLACGGGGRRERGGNWSDSKRFLLRSFHCFSMFVSPSC